MATLTPNQILSDTLASIRTICPALNLFATDFTNRGRFRKGQTVYAHIDVDPTVGDYDPSTGYVNDATEANTLVEDIPVTLNNHKHAALKLDYLNAIADQKDVYTRAINKAAYALVKAIVDDALAEVTTGNFTASETFTHANSDYDMLAAVRKKMNQNGASPFGRAGIVNSDVAAVLDADARIASKDYSGQQVAGEGYATFRNVGGFANIVEYPDMPSTSNLSSFFFDRRAIVVATALPDHSQDTAEALGIPQAGRFIEEMDPVTGMRILGIMWQAPGTFDLYLTATLLWGVTAGAQGGSAGDAADYAGCRVVTS